MESQAHKVQGNQLGRGFRGARPLQLLQNGHKAKFARELISSLPSGFTGVLDISAASPFVALTLRTLTNLRGDFLMATFPVADLGRTAPAPVIFPQIADSGGYVTEFILLSAASASDAILRFYGAGGAPLAVGR